jgi:hypothetical protein
VSTIYSHGGAGNGVGAQGVSRARETPAKLANVLGKRGNDRRRAGTVNRRRQSSTGRKTPLATLTLSRDKICVRTAGATPDANGRPGPQCVRRPTQTNISDVQNVSARWRCPNGSMGTLVWAVGRTVVLYPFNRSIVFFLRNTLQADAHTSAESSILHAHPCKRKYTTCSPCVRLVQLGI